MQVTNSFLDVLRQYFAECVFLPLFVLTLIWIIKKWNKDRKKALLAVSCASILVFNELIYRIFVAVGEGSTYYRMFWMIPIALVLAAGFVEYVFSLQKEKRIMAFTVAFVACVFVSGKSGEEWFSLPENVYQVDDDVIQVSDAMMELTDGKATYLLDDGALTNVVRQYNPKVMSTNDEYYLLDRMLQGRNTNALGRVVQDSLRDNHSRYVAVEKTQPNIYKVFESGGLKLATETDNYRLYYVDYGRLYEDYDERAVLEEGLWNRATHEYISISGFEPELEYVYVTDFGDVDNEAVYQEVLEKIKVTEPNGIIINHKLSENRAWVEYYKESLDALGIPYFCNDKAFQVIDETEITLCLLDNSETVTEETMAACESVLAQEKPVLLVCTRKLEAGIDDELIALITRENSPVVQVLSAMQEAFKKEVLSGTVMQYATPVDEKQQINILRIESLEPKEMIQY